MWIFGQRIRRMTALAGVLLLAGVLAGCSTTGNLSWEKFKETHYRMVTGKTLNEQSIEEQPAVTEDQKEQEQGQEEIQKTVKVVLYFADQSGDFLRGETREIQMVPGLARATVEQLINGPQEDGLMATIPEGTSLRDIDISNGLCRVDLSSEFKDNHWGGSSGEILTVFSLVDTLTQFPTVQNVEILVEGQKIETLAGHMDLSVPVSRNADLIKSGE